MPSTIMPPTCQPAKLARTPQLAINNGYLALLAKQVIDRRPHAHDAGALRGEHAVLETVQILAVDGRNEFTGQQAQDDTRREVVLADAGAELEVLVEHGAEG